MESALRRHQSWGAVGVIGVVIACTASTANAQSPRHAPVASTGKAAPSTATTEEYRIGPEDVLDVLVWRNPDLAKTVQVRPDGRISLPLVNDVQAADLTPMQLKAALTKGYAPFIADPEVSVIVKEIHSVKVSVIGLVKTTGRFELRSSATVLDALAIAGGFAEFAKRDRVIVRRRGGTSVLFNYMKLLDDPAAEENIALQPGDIIIVP